MTPQRRYVETLAANVEFRHGLDALETVIERFVLSGDRAIVENVHDDKLKALEAALLSEYHGGRPTKF